MNRMKKALLSRYQYHFNMHDDISQKIQSNAPTSATLAVGLHSKREKTFDL